MMESAIDSHVLQKGFAKARSTMSQDYGMPELEFC